MSLILSTDFHNGSLIEKVSGKAFTVRNSVDFKTFDKILCLGDCMVQTPTNLSFFPNNMCISFALRTGGSRTASGSVILNGTNFTIYGGPSTNTIPTYLPKEADGTYRYYLGTIGTIKNSKLTHILINIRKDTGYLSMFVNGNFVWGNDYLAPNDLKSSLYSSSFGINGFSGAYSRIYANEALCFMNIFDTPLSSTEIQNEYQYFLNLKSPSKPVYFSYKPKPNKLIDGLKYHFDFSNVKGNKVYDKTGSGVYATLNAIEKLPNCVKTLKNTQPADRNAIITNVNLIAGLTSWSITYFFDNFSAAGYGTTFGYVQNGMFSLSNFYSSSNVNSRLFIRGVDNVDKEWNGNGNTKLCQSLTVMNRPIQLILTYDGTKVTLFVNNVNYGYINFTPAELSWQIWRLTNGINFDSSFYAAILTLKEVKIYNKALTSDDVNIEYQSKLRTTLHEDFSNYPVGTFKLPAKYRKHPNLDLQIIEYPKVPIDKRNPFINGGADDTTDWVDSNGDGLADGYGAIGGTPTIVTGNGFTDRAQRITSTGSGAALQSNAILGLYKYYKISFYYRSNLNMNIYGAGVINHVVVPPASVATYYEGYILGVPPYNNQVLTFYLIYCSPNDWLEIDKIKLEEVENPLKLISNKALQFSYTSTNRYLIIEDNTIFGIKKFQMLGQAGASTYIGAYYRHYFLFDGIGNGMYVQMSYDNYATTIYLYLANNVELGHYTSPTIGYFCKILFFEVHIEMDKIQVYVNNELIITCATPTMNYTNKGQYISIPYYIGSVLGSIESISI